GQSFAAFGADLLDSFFRAFAIEIGHNHGCALTREPQCAGTTDTAAGTSDNGHFIFQSSHDVVLVSQFVLAMRSAGDTPDFFARSAVSRYSRQAQINP